jgi:hypothetical protein
MSKQYLIIIGWFYLALSIISAVLIKDAVVVIVNILIANMYYIYADYKGSQC